MLTAADGGEMRGTGATTDASATNRAVPCPIRWKSPLLEQGDLLDRAIDALPPSTPAAELYTLTLAGDGRQSVFMREADYVQRLLAERFHAHGQLSTVNHRDHLADRPLATRENTGRAIRAWPSAAARKT